MVRLVVLSLSLALALSGCQLAFGVDTPDLPEVCGPYGAPTPVTFDPRLVEPHDFSVDASGTRGMVHARYDQTPTVKKTRPHAIKLDPGSSTWVPDDARNVGLDSLYGGHMVGDGSVFGWVDRTSITTPDLHQYTFQTTSWSQVAELLDTETLLDLRAGNYVEIPIEVGGSAKLQLLVEIKVPADGTRSTMRILAQTADGPWGPTGKLDPLARASAKISPSTGNLTADENRFVYAATVGSDPVSHLYASERSLTNEFAPGERLVIATLTNADALTEPWINADCTALYFRWNDETWMSTLDATQGAQ